MYVLTTHNNSVSGHLHRNKCRIYAPDIHRKMQDYKPRNPKPGLTEDYVVSVGYFPSKIKKQTNYRHILQKTKTPKQTTQTALKEKILQNQKTNP